MTDQPARATAPEHPDVVDVEESNRQCGATGVTDGGWQGRCILPLGHEGRCLDVGID